ncbi:hypothetical protein ACFOD9_05890 [Novosphingobium bradum]|uniref:Uncharacterized protein n=1 Tax=Novosphingobium bradum TaxID=1737444 RepID=A0ABV7IM72_9SPHN
MKANRAQSRFVSARRAMLAPRLMPLLAPVLMVAACAAPPPAAPPPPPPAAPPPPVVADPPPPADWRDAAQTPGTWRWRMEGDQSIAEYGPYGGAPLARLTCDPHAQATILWRNWPAAGAVPLAVTTTGARRLLTMTPDGAAGARASLAPFDPLLDAIAFSRGRFMVEMQGAPVLYLPAWPELSRVIEDCRQKLESASPPAPGGSPEASPKP